MRKPGIVKRLCSLFDRAVVLSRGGPARSGPSPPLCGLPGHPIAEYKAGRRLCLCNCCCTKQPDDEQAAQSTGLHTHLLEKRLALKFRRSEKAGYRAAMLLPARKT